MTMADMLRRLMRGDDADGQPNWRYRRLDGGANRPLEVSKATSFATLLPPTAVSVSKAVAYIVVIDITSQLLPVQPRILRRLIAADDSVDWAPTYRRAPAPPGAPLVFPARPPMARLRVAPQDDEVLPITWGRRRVGTPAAVVVASAGGYIWVNT